MQVICSFWSKYLFIFIVLSLMTNTKPGFKYMYIAKAEKTMKI